MSSLLHGTRPRSCVRGEPYGNPTTGLPKGMVHGHGGMILEHLKVHAFHMNPDLWVSSISGGTDVATGFVGGVPTLPVHSGEIQGHCLGVGVHSFDSAGNSLIDEEGELVITQPMPTMPLYFWNDPEGQRYHESYFGTYPGVWRHGDLIRITERGSSIISGRSDATLNRHGVRIGTSEIYRSVERMDEVIDAMIVHLDGDDENARMPLFVVLREGLTLDEDLTARIRSRIREERSPRHVPDVVLQAPIIPYTLTGEKMEVPTKKILLGAAPEKVANPDAMANPESLPYFAALAAQLSGNDGKYPQ